MVRNLARSGFREEIGAPFAVEWIFRMGARRGRNGRRNAHGDKYEYAR
jgi:hypothetical protein